MVKTIDQEAARFSRDTIDQVNGGSDDLKKKYRSLVRGFAAMVQMNGLPSALAFLKAKGKQEHTVLYGHINEWIENRFAANQQNFDVLSSVECGDDQVLRLYTQSTIQLMSWLRKYAEAELPEPDDQDQGD